MTKIVVISQLPPPIHGSTIMTQTFLEVMEELGHEYRLVDRRFSSSVSEVGKFSLRKLVAAALMPFRLLTTMRSFRPGAVVFFATNRTFSFLVDWVLSEVTRWFPVYRINYLHTVGFEALASRNSIFAWMTGRLLRSAHATVHLGPALANDITRWVRESRIRFIPNVVEPPADLGERSPDAPPLVLYLSNLIPEKGADTFVDMAIDLASTLSDTKFVIAGATADDTFTNCLGAKVEDANLSSQIQLLGAITVPEQKWRLLRDASVLVFPSTYPFEAQPLTILEARSTGTPVVAYDVGGIRDVIGTMHGKLVEPGNVRLLAASVRDLLQHAPLRQRDEGTSDPYSRERYAASWGSLLRLTLLVGSTRSRRDPPS